MRESVLQLHRFFPQPASELFTPDAAIILLSIVFISCPFKMYCLHSHFHLDRCGIAAHVLVHLNAAEHPPADLHIYITRPKA